MQKEQLQQCINPSRIFSQFYRKEKPINSDSYSSKSNIYVNLKNRSGGSSVPSIPMKKKSKLVSEIVDISFAQRYADEIAPPAKMKEYENIAQKQRHLLFKETQSLQKRFSQDFEESARLEQTVLGISSLVAEFASLLDSQSGIVEDVGETAREVTQSVQSADDELLLTIERTQSQQWNMVILLFTLSLLLLTLHVITP